jgi:hypothetical protein
MNKIELRRFDCPVLGGVALIQITKRYRTAAQLPQPQLARIDFTDCANSLQCGIATEVSYGNWTFDWDKCPAYKKNR